MENIANNVAELIGNTPLVKLGKMNDGKARILLKLEYFNPSGSVKDRAALAMIDDAERSGKLQKGSLIIEPTSGNTGIGLALVAATRGYKLVLTMPETMSVERRKLLQSYGAELVLTEGSKGMAGAVEKAEELQRENPGSFIPQQFANPANSEAHEKSTAMEIWRDTDGNVDAIVAGVGTGGTLTGCARGLKRLKPSIKAYAVEPAASPMLSEGRAGPHGIQGIGANFVPKIYDKNLVDEIITVSDADAANTARKLASTEGIHSGMSAGAAVFAAINLSKRLECEGKTIVVIIPDTGTRYLSSQPYSEKK